MPNERYIIQAMGMHSSKYGGLERFIVSLAHELNQANIKTIVIYNSRPQNEIFLQDLTNAGGILVISHAMKPFNYFLDLRNIFTTYRPVLLHAHFQFYYSVLFARLLNCKQIYYSMHGMDLDKKSRIMDNQKQMKSSTRIIRSVTNKFSNRIFAVSEAVKKQQIELFPHSLSKIERHYLGSQPNDKKEESQIKHFQFNTGKILIGTIGFNNRVKGLDVLMNAAFLLRNKHHIHNFMICQLGIDPIATENRNLIEEFNQMGLKQNIIWMGIRNDIDEILPELDIYCQPSRSEGLPLSIMEAGMAGLPVIGSNVGGIPEIVTDGFNGYLFKSEDAEDLANKLSLLINNKEIRETMGARSRERMMTNFNLRIQAKSMSDYYQKKL